MSKREAPKKKEARAPEGIKGQKVETKDGTNKGQKAATIAQGAAGAPVKTGGSALVGFIGGEDDADAGRGRGRGGRGGDKGPKDKGPRQNKAALSKYSKNDFPTLDA